MGFARDLGATMTFGLSVTTKHKEGRYQVRKPPETTRGALECLQRGPSTVQSSLEAMDAHFAAAQEILLSAGALTSDVSNNVIYGWYRRQEEVESGEQPRSRP